MRQPVEQHALSSPKRPRTQGPAGLQDSLDRRQPVEHPALSNQSGLRLRALQDSKTARAGGTQTSPKPCKAGTDSNRPATKKAEPTEDNRTTTCTGLFFLLEGLVRDVSRHGHKGPLAQRPKVKGMQAQGPATTPKFNEKSLHMSLFRNSKSRARGVDEVPSELHLTQGDSETLA